MHYILSIGRLCLADYDCQLALWFVYRLALYSWYIVFLLLKPSLIYLLAGLLAVFICFAFFVRIESELSFGDLFWSLFYIKTEPDISFGTLFWSLLILVE